MVAEAEWAEIAALLAPVGEQSLRRLLWESGVRVAQPLAGVRQGSFPQLEESLLEMGAAYREALESGDRERARRCRRVVIQAKDHARLAALNRRTAPRKRTEKEEMVRWMLVWLENPPVFPGWVKLRKRAMGLEPQDPPEDQ
ncbi:MAG: hypothetical protein IT158_15140 [Bryobacterales bacterium]|nr:hypothetical protein [Bryobacterales bacterium]